MTTSSKLGVNFFETWLLNKNKLIQINSGLWMTSPISRLRKYLQTRLRNNKALFAWFYWNSFWTKELYKPYAIVRNIMKTFYIKFEIKIKKNESENYFCWGVEMTETIYQRKWIAVDKSYTTIISSCYILILS